MLHQPLPVMNWNHPQCHGETGSTGQDGKGFDYFQQRLPFLYVLYEQNGGREFGDANRLFGDVVSYDNDAWGHLETGEIPMRR